MWRSTHLKLQHGSLRNLNGARVVLFYVQNREVFFLNDFMHMLEYSVIVAVDMEGNTWRIIRQPGGAEISIHQAQGHLCVCCADFRNRSWLLVWILEDYGTDNWS